MRVVQVILFIGAIVIVFGALFFFFGRQVDIQQTSQLSSARDVTGIWEGKAAFTDTGALLVVYNVVETAVLPLRDDRLK